MYQPENLFIYLFKVGGLKLYKHVKSTKYETCAVLHRFLYFVNFMFVRRKLIKVPYAFEAVYFSIMVSASLSCTIM